VDSLEPLFIYTHKSSYRKCCYPIALMGFVVSYIIECVENFVRGFTKLLKCKLSI
jgi:hypothetical protein